MVLTALEIDFSNSGTRNEVRERVIHKFLEENPGNGKGEKASKYDYIVEYLTDGRTIVLTRPANLKNGFDFLIRVTDTNFAGISGKKRDYPKHEEIIEDLRMKKNTNNKDYLKLFELIEQIYNCNYINTPNLSNLHFNVGHPVDLVLGVIKWFFVEQDIRYWNYSGRGMFMSGIPKP